MMSPTRQMHPLKLLATTVGAALFVLGLLLAYASSPAWAAQITVNSTADTVVDDDGLCTLREAINAANNDTTAGTIAGECAAGSGDDVITFELPGTAPWTVSLTGALPDLSSTIVIDGPGADQLTVKRDTGGNYRIFTVTGTTTDVTISGMTISNGNVPSDFGGGIRNNGGTVTVTDSTISGNSAHGGGGIVISGNGTVIVTNSTISGNSASGGGGGGIRAGIFNTDAPTLRLTNSTISGNSAGFGGGGILNAGNGTVIVTNSTISRNPNTGTFGGGGISNLDQNGTVTVTDSTISGNSSAGFGGGINNAGTLTVTGSTISGNSVGDTRRGGGIYIATGVSRLTSTITNSTISGNSAGFGGGIYSNTFTGSSARSTTTITNSTISGNTATSEGGGVDNGQGLTVIEHSTITNNTAPSGEGSGVVTSVGATILTEVLSSIISANQGTDVDSGTTTGFLSKGYNLIGDGDATGAFNQTGDQTGVTDPGLDPLDSYGGPTQTHRLQSDSLALDAGPPTDGNPIACPPPTTDQRGVTRPQDGNGDSTSRCDIGAFELEEDELVVELSPGDDFYSERACPPDGDETVNARGGNDILRLDPCGDTTSEPEPSDSDVDVGNGQGGNDVIRVDDGDIQDTARGGGGTDQCRGDLDLGASAASVDEPPIGPGGGEGAEEDIGDTLRCEQKTWIKGFTFYTQS